MFDVDTIKKIKSCTVAIGLVEKDGNFPYDLCGSGFLISPKGYVMTAAHVSDRCLELIELRKAEGKDLERAAFFASRDSEGHFHFYGARIEQKVFRSTMIQKPKGYAMPQDIDVAVFNIGPKIPLPHLEMKEPSEIQLYEEVAISSYPSGLQTMNWQSDAYIGRRLSPLIQFGRLVSFFPMDDAPIPNGIQTDIVATGGTSGAAVVDHEEKVVGIALQVIRGAAIEGTRARYSTNTGLAYGLSSNILKKFSESLDTFFEGGTVDVSIPVEMTTFGDVSFDRLF